MTIKAIEDDEKNNKIFKYTMFVKQWDTVIELLKKDKKNKSYHWNYPFSAFERLGISEDERPRYNSYACDYAKDIYLDCRNCPLENANKCGLSTNSKWSKFILAAEDNNYDTAIKIAEEIRDIKIKKGVAYE